MVQSRPPVRRRPVWAAGAASLLLVALLVGAGERPAAAAVTTVTGEACSYAVNVGLFGGPQTLNGCGEAGRLPAANAPGGPTAPGSTDTSYSPHVRVTGAGGAMSASDANGASAVYGPAVIHGGRWPCDEGGDRNCPASAPPSGPQAASTSGSAASGSVTASADISLHTTPVPVACYSGYGPSCYSTGGFGPFPVEGDSMHVECTANESGVSGSASFANAQLATSTDGEGNPVDLEPVPSNPPVNYTRHGVITNVGDVFTVVYNQQIVNADGSLTVIGTHMYLFGPTAVGEVIRGKVTCGTTPSAATPTDTVAPSCGTPVVKPMGPEDPTPQTPRSELVGTFDAGGLQSITNVHVANGTVQVGDPSSSFGYLRFNPGQTGPLAVTATRTEEAEAAGRPLAWSFDATDGAGNTSHCRGVFDVAAGDDAYRTRLGTPLTVAAPGVLANDADADGNTLSAGLVTAPAGGSVTLQPDGSFTYTPNFLFIGDDTFTYAASDGQGGSDLGSVTITVGLL